MQYKKDVPGGAQCWCQWRGSGHSLQTSCVVDIRSWGGRACILGIVNIDGSPGIHMEYHHGHIVLGRLAFVSVGKRRKGPTVYDLSPYCFLEKFILRKMLVLSCALEDSDGGMRFYSCHCHWRLEEMSRWVSSYRRTVASNDKYYLLHPRGHRRPSIFVLIPQICRCIFVRITVLISFIPALLNRD